MPYRMKDRPKILRTQLDYETHTSFKMLAAELRTTMAKLVEKMVRERIAQAANDRHWKILIKEEIWMDFKKGEKWKLYFNENNINNKLIHIRGIIDDVYIVTRSWSTYKNRWIYDINHKVYFDILKKDESLTIVK